MTCDRKRACVVPADTQARAFKRVFSESPQVVLRLRVPARSFGVTVKAVWTDDDYPGTRSCPVDKMSPIEKIIDSDEFDLGIVGLIDLELEPLRRG